MSRVTVNSVRNINEMLKNPWYKIYYEIKQEILQRYPPIKQRSREEHLSYMKELCDVIWEQDGPFQNFVWDVMSEQDKLIQERKATGKRKPGPSSYEEEYI